MATAKSKLKNFDTERRDRLEGEDAPVNIKAFNFVFGGIEWDVEPRPIPAGVSLDLIRAQRDMEEEGAIEFLEATLNFLAFVLGEGQADKFSEMLYSTELEHPPEMTDVIEMAFWVLEKLSDRPS